MRFAAQRSHTWLAIASISFTAACGGSQPAPADQRSDAPAPSVDYTPVSPAPDDELATAMWEIAGSGTPSDSPIHTMWQSYLEEIAEELPAPRAILSYAPGDVPPIACADQLTAEEWADNAFYCPADQTIVYDLSFVRSFVDAVDESAASAILAHEWGHHIQDVLDESRFSIQHELQADCYAGLFASRQDLDSGRYTESVGSAEAFYELGNEQYSNSRWFSTGEHGSPRQRFAAWSLGYQSLRLGFELCHGYGDWTPGRSVDIGPFRFVELPGRPGELTDTLYVLEDDELSHLTIEYVDVDALAGNGPGELLQAWIEMRFGASLGVLDGPHTSERPEEAAFFYYAAEPDEATGQYARHGIFGIQISPDDPGHALIFDAPAVGRPPIEGDGPAELTAAVEHAFQMALTAAERICAPHHTTDDGPAETHNEMCYPDL